MVKEIVCFLVLKKSQKWKVILGEKCKKAFMGNVKSVGCNKKFFRWNIFLFRQNFLIKSNIWYQRGKLLNHFMLRHGTSEGEGNIFRSPKTYLTSYAARLKCSDEIIKSKS